MVDLQYGQDQIVAAYFYGPDLYGGYGGHIRIYKYHGRGHRLYQDYQPPVGKVQYPAVQITAADLFCRYSRGLLYADGHIDQPYRQLGRKKPRCGKIGLLRIFAVGTDFSGHLHRLSDACPKMVAQREKSRSEGRLRPR